MQAYLKKHSPGHADHSVKIEWSNVNREVFVKFSITKRTSAPWSTDSVFTQDWLKNWGLWNKDVVEAFIQLRSSAEDTRAPYLEVQLSPLNQPFALIITEPRKTFYPPKTLELSHETNVEGRVWSGSMNFKLPEELEGTLLYGGFFACLGEGSREFHALEPNPESNPDFHRPELFLPLGEV